jgi:hypothetical protein
MARGGGTFAHDTLNNDGMQPAQLACHTVAYAPGESSVSSVLISIVSAFLVYTETEIFS